MAELKTKQPISTKAKVGGGIGAVVTAVLAAVFTMEGGYVNNVKDPGGETNHGITKAVAVSHGYTAPMKSMPKDIAEDIYKRDYIVQPGYMPLLEVSPAVGHKVIDIGVNAGTGRSSRWLQTALNAVNRNGQDYPKINVDGAVGSGTISSYKSLVRVRGKVAACEMVIKLLDAQQATHYMNLTHLYTFTPGWVINRVGNVPLSECQNES